MKKTIIISGICFVIDFIIKTFLINFMNFNTHIELIKSFMKITLVQNTGAAFSILESNTTLLIILSTVVLFSIFTYLLKNKDTKKEEFLIYGILIGGILGNLFDRIVYGYVIDYLDFNIFGYNAPVFNFADICIVVSMGLIIIEMIRDGKNEISSRRKRH